jgi:nucleotide-binding universal stress UspA family protein
VLKKRLFLILKGSSCAGEIVPMTVKSVLLPIDGSDCSEQTLQWVTENFLDKTTYQLFLLQVIPHVYSEIPMDDYQVEGAVACLKKARQFLESAGYTVQKAEYILGDPVKSICDVATEFNVNVVLIGSHGKSGIKKVLMGSVSSDVLAHCKRPVLVYKNINLKAS